MRCQVPVATHGWPVTPSLQAAAGYVQCVFSDSWAAVSGTSRRATIARIGNGIHLGVLGAVSLILMLQFPIGAAPSTAVVSGPREFPDGLDPTSFQMLFRAAKRAKLSRTPSSC